MRKKHPIRRLLTLLLLVALVAGLAAMPMLSSRGAQEQDNASILTAQAQRRTLNQFLCYGAPLETQEPEAVTVPSGVGVTEYLVSNGDSVQAGDPIAKVDTLSVMTAAQQVQQSLETISSEMQQLRKQITPGAITVDAEGSLLVDGKAVDDDQQADYLQFAALSEQHREYEQLLLELFLLRQDGTVTAPCDGMVGDVDKNQVVELSASGTGRVVFLAKNTPTGEDDDTDYYCYVGKIEQIQDSGWFLRLGSEITVTDFLALDGLNVTLTDEVRIFDPSYAAVFGHGGDGWYLTTAQPGDIVLVVGNAPWIIVIGSSDPTPTEPTDPSESTDPTGPSDPTEPSDPSDPTGPIGPSDPTDPTEPSRPGQMPGGGGGGMISIGGFGGGAAQEKEEDSLYSTETLQLASVTPMEIMSLTLSVDEADIGSLSLGASAQVSFEALPNQSFTARITELSQFGEAGDGSGKFSVKLELPWAQGMLSGMNAKVRIPLESRDDCLTIPVAALAEQGNKTLVYTGIDEDSQALTGPTLVETGLSDGEYVQILSGLTEGTTVWYRYYDQLELSNSVEKKSSFG